IRNVGGTYLPLLQGGMRQVAAAMGAMVQVSGKALMRPETIDASRVALDNTADAFRELIPTGGAVVRAFAQIGAVGSEFLPGLAAGVSEVATRFADWATAAAESGRLHDIISQGLSVLGDLGKVAGNVGATLVNVFRAASDVGGGMLNSLKEMTGALAQITGSVQGQDAMRSFFAANAQLVSQFVAALKSIAPAIGSVLTVVGTLGSGISAGLGPAFAAVVPAVNAFAAGLVPIAQQLGGALTDALTAVAPLLGQLASTVGSVLLAALNAVTPLLPMLTDTIGQLAGIISTALAAATPVLTQIAGALGGIPGSGDRRAAADPAAAGLRHPIDRAGSSSRSAATARSEEHTSE